MSEPLVLYEVRRPAAVLTMNRVDRRNALSRGLINEDQLLQALGEQHGLKVVNLAEVKPQPEALQLVPENMANVYKVLPLTFKDKCLTIAIGDPNHLTAVDDLRNLLSVGEVVAQLSHPQALSEALAKAYAGKEVSILDIITEIENTPKLGKRKAETRWPRIPGCCGRHACGTAWPERATACATPKSSAPATGRS